MNRLSVAAGLLGKCAQRPSGEALQYVRNQRPPSSGWPL